MEPAVWRANRAPSPATLGRPVAQRVALALLITVAALGVVYLIASNVILRTRLLRDMVSQGDDVELEYASAYSVWPGLVHVRSLSLKVQDYSIQFAVLADSGVVRVSLHDLFFRRFRATQVDLQVLRFDCARRSSRAKLIRRGSPPFHRSLALPIRRWSME